MGRNKNWPSGAWSHSRFSTLRACHRKHHLRYVEKVYPKGFKPDVLQIGIFTHEVLEYVSRLAKDGVDLKGWHYEQALQAAEASEEITNPKNFVEGARLIQAYRDEYGDENAGWPGAQILDVEKVFKAKDLHRGLGGFAAIADIFIEDSQGIAVGERKTGAKMPSRDENKILEGLRTRPQLLSLAYCARDELGEAPDVIYDLIVKTKDVQFYRPRIKFSDAELDAYAEEQKMWEDVVHSKAPNRDQCDPPIGSRCDYFSYCWGSPGEREQLYEISKKPKT